MKKKILIVDDELFFRAMLKKNLQGNFDIIEGANGHEAVSLCREKLPDLIILDIEMPVCDGIEACKILKADPRPENPRYPVYFTNQKEGYGPRPQGWRR